MSTWTELNTVERQETAARLQAAGLSYAEIAKELGTTRFAVAGALYRRAHGNRPYVPAPGSTGRKPPPKQPRRITSAADLAEFRAMWLRGVQMKAMARHFGCSIACIDTTRVREGLPRREPTKDKCTVSSYLEREDYEALSKRAFDQGIAIALLVRNILLDALKPQP